MARWIDIAKWVGPTDNEGGNMTGHDGVVIHIAAGYFDGTISWQRNKDANVSSHFIVGKTAADGTVQMVDTSRRSWAQRDGNGRWLSIENVGFVGDKLTPYQLEMNARILVKAHQIYGVPLQVTNNPRTHGLGHHSMGAENGLDWGHSACPGAPIKAQKAEIVALAQQIVNGDDDMFTDEDRARLYATDGRVRRLMEGAESVPAGQPGGPLNIVPNQRLRELREQLDAGQEIELSDADITRLAAALPAPTLTDADVLRIATATADIIQGRLQS